MDKTQKAQLGEILTARERFLGVDFELEAAVERYLGESSPNREACLLALLDQQEAYQDYLHKVLASISPLWRSFHDSQQEEKDARS